MVGPRADAECTDQQLVTRLRQLVVESDRFAEMFGETRGIHRTDLNALAVIMHADHAGRSLSPGDLAGSLHLSASAVTALLDRLEAAGHIRRERGIADRRRVELRVNDRALDVGRAFFAPLGAEMSRVWAEFGQSERRIIDRFLALSTEATVRVREQLTAPDQH
ncbi:MarR family winged helix-turn-helix transcriptional regulator [Actinokineospora xionganensis]|uniref:MarR family transcriptional regulator n=1 Tax=Actinokineospora xionganensis TaxID=2684470 RepID=A0ABR7L0U7_9PSEU|nr:MarR family transcriptional regulator [Actinokineospora xionganensis]MBC6446217.1 MarR family transcriptional regulator [Actinokineospora xionganensis]